jgi:hypothetical protein
MLSGLSRKPSWSVELYVNGSGRSVIHVPVQVH